MKMPDGERLFIGFWMALLCALAAGLLAICVVAVVANHRPDYCYVQQQYGGGFLLRAHCPWAADDTIGRFETITVTADAAKAINCPIGKP